MNKLKICFLWYFSLAEKVYPNWRDGLRGAMEIISKKHDVDWVLGEKLPEDKYDFILVWSDSNCEFFKHLNEYKGRKGICLTTDPTNMLNISKLDVTFVESQPIFDQIRPWGFRCIKAFGTDTDFYNPNPTIKKDIEFFYPATFSPWKKQGEIAHLGKDLWCVGIMQPDGLDEFNKCREAGVHVEVDYFPAEKIRDYYNRAKNTIIPAVHGSERTMLESMAMGIVPQVLHPENVRISSYITEFLNSPYTEPRDFILNNYSHTIYSQQLLKGIENE